MPDPAREKCLVGYNRIEIWVEAEGKRLNEDETAYDAEQKRHESRLCTPLYKDLTINIVVHAKGPCTSDLAFEISFDGRPIHPVYIKRGNHQVVRVRHFFGRENGEPTKTSFRVQEIATSDHPMILTDLPSKEDQGEISIAVWKASLRKGGQGSEAILWRNFQALVDDLPDNRLCISAGPSEPCAKAEMKSIYRPAQPYKTEGAKPWITYVYKYREPRDQSEDFKEGIAEASVQRSLPDANSRELFKRMDRMERRLEVVEARERSVNTCSLSDPESEYDGGPAWRRRVPTGSPLQEYDDSSSQLTKREYP